MADYTSHMAFEISRQFSRMVAARQRLLELRSERIEALMQLRVCFRQLLNEFAVTLDPVGSSRLVEIAADGSKAHGDLAITVGFFEGTRFRIAVDTTAKYTFTITVPGLLDDVDHITEVRVSADHGSADLVYVSREDHAMKRVDLVALVAHLAEHAVRAVEMEVEGASGATTAVPSAISTPTPIPLISAPVATPTTMTAMPEVPAAAPTVHFAVEPLSEPEIMPIEPEPEPLVAAVREPAPYLTAVPEPQPQLAPATVAAAVPTPTPKRFSATFEPEYSGAPPSPAAASSAPAATAVPVTPIRERITSAPIKRPDLDAEPPKTRLTYSVG